MNKLFKRFAAISLSTMIAFGLISCGNNAEKKDNTANQSSQVGEVVYPVTITDSFGKEVTLDKEPKKIISVAPNITEMIYELGAEGKLVGRTDYCDYPKEVTNIESIGNLMTPDIEKIILQLILIRKIQLNLKQLVLRL